MRGVLRIATCGSVGVSTSERILVYGHRCGFVHRFTQAYRVPAARAPCHRDRRI